MSSIVPAILPHTQQDVQDKLLAVQGVAEEVQIDLVDGVYAGPATWPFAGDVKGLGLQAEMTAAMRMQGSLLVEVDLMVSRPDVNLSRWIDSGASRITIHADSTPLLSTVLEEIHTLYGHDREFTPNLLSFGLAVGTKTDMAIIEPFLETCDYVQFMGIDHIGVQGQPFNKEVIQRIKTFHAKYPDMQIQVDGGVSLDTAPALLDAGASRLIVGSSFWKARDLQAVYAAFVDLTNRYGLYA